MSASRSTAAPHSRAAYRYGSGAGFQRRTASTDTALDELCDAALEQVPGEFGAAVGERHESHVRLVQPPHPGLDVAMQG